MLGVFFFFFFFFSFQVSLGVISLNHITPSTKGKVIPKVPKVQKGFEYFFNSLELASSNLIEYTRGGFAFSPG